MDSIFVHQKKYMIKRLLVAAFLFITIQAQAQLGVIKMVGNNTSKYDLGYGAYLKMGYPVSKGSDVTLQIGAYLFVLNDGGVQEDGTAVVPLTAGYRYTLNRKGSGLYVEPQIGYNLYGVSSVNVNGNTVNLHYHGAIFGAGMGYLFPIKYCPLDLNLNYQTIVDHGGSTNYVSLGLAVYLGFKRRDRDDY
jgi:hypothetical protein